MRNYLDSERKILLYNTLSGKKEPFIPLDKDSAAPTVKMYVCGLTPYIKSHMGHLVPALRFNAIINYLEYRGLKVNYVQNVTDIDDKIINHVLKTGEDPVALSRKITDEYYSYLKGMHIRLPDRIVRVTETIPQVIQYVQELIDRGFAYATDSGNVYFDIAKKSDYGKLSRQKSSDLQEGVRIESETDKRSSLDFALWKSDDSTSLSSDSPWGRGRPGWHIECSVMIDYALGTPIDIHGGGLDLKFPHHENEIAQSEAHDGCTFANFWIHAGLLNVDGTKMSKSLGNFLFIDEAFERFTEELIRYVFLVHHYRSNINLTEQAFLENINGLFDMYKALRLCELLHPESNTSGSQKFESVRELTAEFEAAMDDDINTPVALVALRKGASHLKNLLSEVESEKSKAEIQSLSRALTELGNVLGLFRYSFTEVCQQLIRFISNIKKVSPIAIEELEELLKSRAKARQEKNYAESDRVRDVLKTHGLEYLDSKNMPNKEGIMLTNLRFLNA